MATGAISTVLHHLRRAALLRDGAGLPDGQLLECFVERREEAAFAALVRRHGPMVMGVCRRLLRNPCDVEDAFQATFLVLVRKAATIVPRDRVANWLYGVAQMTARRARVMAAKRAVRERQLVKMPEPELVQPSNRWEDLRPVLDLELSGLPERYRLPILLCDLEGKSIKEAARQLAWPQGTLAGRLARGRRMLAKRLTRHGPMLSGGALAAILAENASAACTPVFLVSSTVKAAILLARGEAAAGLISTQALALTKGVAVSMLLNKVKLVMVVFLVLGTTALGGGWAVTKSMAWAQEGQADQVPAEAPISPATAASKVPVKTEGTVPSFVIKTRVSEVGPDGKPQAISAPIITVLEDCVAECVIDTGSVPLLPNAAGEMTRLKDGTVFKIKVKRADAGKVLVLLTFEISKTTKVENGKTLIDVHHFETTEQTELAKPARIILSKDHQGNAQLWFDLMVSIASEADFQHEVTPLPQMAPPARVAKPASKGRNPQNPWTAWPGFIY